MMPQAVLTRAIEKLASAGEQAGISVADMIRILQAGVSVEALVNLIEHNLPIAEESYKLRAEACHKSTRAN
jgi:hypothetical protein